MKVLSNLPQLLALIAMLQRFGNAQNILGFLNAAKNAVVKEVASVKNPILSGVSYLGSSQCDLLKNVTRQNYEATKGADEPDVGNLTLVYISPDFRAEIPLHSAAAVLPKTFVCNNSTKIYVFLHGFTDNPDNENFQTISNALQKTGNCNILALDASPLIGWMYLRSSTYVRFIGTALGQVLAQLYFETHLAPENIHLIGHSLGAHIAAFAAKEFFRMTKLKVGRLDGLDVAGPCFTEIDSSIRFGKTDATFVTAIHTNGGVYGMTESVAQADFYPNEGQQQPGCIPESCNHGMAVKFYATSINSMHSFLAVKCNNYGEYRKGKCSNETTPMGHASVPGMKGDFYLQTNAEEPYARGIQGITYDNKDGIVKKLQNFFTDILG